MSARRLYQFLGIICLLGFIYLLVNFYTARTGFRVCILKNVTGFPCPSCGTTRAVMLFLHGEFRASVLMNPFGIIVTLLMFGLPAWIAFDSFTKKQTLYHFYKKAEIIISRKWLAATFILLVLINWIWNIYKNL